MGETYRFSCRGRVDYIQGVLTFEAFTQVPVTHSIHVIRVNYNNRSPTGNEAHFRNIPVFTMG